jgi:hypothetical protein
MKSRAICLLVVFFTCTLFASPRKCGPNENTCVHETAVNNMVIQVQLAPVTAEEIELLPIHTLMGNL